jgi:hypothetical protein
MGTNYYSIPKVEDLEKKRQKLIEEIQSMDVSDAGLCQYDFRIHEDVIIKGRSVYNTNGNRIYYETSNGSWVKYEYDTNGNKIYSEDSNGFWRKYEYDTNDNQIYSEDSNGYWYKKEYDEQGREVYYENSNGVIEDNRYERQI